MDITVTEQIVIEYTQKLTSADLERYLADPWQWRDDVQAQLGIQKAANGNGHKATRQERGVYVPGIDHPGNGKKRAGKAAGKRAAKKTAPKGDKPLHPCPHCERTFKHQGRLNNHLRDAHSQNAASSTATSAVAPTWSPAPAAAAE